jgi:hypothetical protein
MKEFVDLAMKTKLRFLEMEWGKNQENGRNFLVISNNSWGIRRKMKLRKRKLKLTTVPL